MSISTPVWSAHHPVVLLCPRISISCLLLQLFVLRSQWHLLPSIFLFFRQLGSTYSPTLTCSMPHVLFPYIHLALILDLFLHLPSLGEASRRLHVFLAFTLSSLSKIWSNSFSSPVLNLQTFIEYAATRITLMLIAKIRFVSLSSVFTSIFTLFCFTFNKFDYNFGLHSISLFYP